MGLPFFEVSARTGSGVNELFAHAAEARYEIVTSSSTLKRTISPKAKKKGFFKKIFKRDKKPSKKNKEFPRLHEYDYLFKIVLVGDAAIGKSCLVLRFAEPDLKG